MTLNLIVFQSHEPRHEKTCPVHMREQTRISAAQKFRSCLVLCFRYVECTASLHVFFQAFKINLLFVSVLVSNPGDMLSRDTAHHRSSLSVAPQDTFYLFTWESKGTCLLHSSLAFATNKVKLRSFKSSE